NPTGGLKDSIAPILVSATPNHKTVNFKAKKIKIYFDEYIKLKDVNKQLVISPPQKNNPIISPVGTASKLITIEILDTLDVNTTYAFNFGKSIVDNNEENELGNFKYIFSTGTYIDSLELSGEVTDPMVKKSEKELDVMLYEYNESYTDSIIFKQKPRYISNTLDSTLYEITNLRAGKYLLIALKDANGNKIYNPEVDKIGFVKDTITIPTDKKFNFPIFKEIPKLKVIKPKEVTKGHLIFGYLGAAKDLNINLLTATPEGFKSEFNFEKDKDTINYWYTAIEIDSLNFKVSKGEYSEEFTVKTRSSKIDSLIVKKSTSSVLHLIDTFSISTNIPIINIDKSLIKITDQDTIAIDFNTILSKSKTKLHLNFDKKDNFKYNFELLPKAITTIFGASNDSLAFQLTTKSPEDYGILNLELSSEKKSSFIVELLDEKGFVVRIKKIDSPQIINFILLPPGNYSVRVTVDENNNGVWDTGDFLRRQQPEIVKYFDKEIIIRANWDEPVIFILK
ncbi:Ig-like domain-containing protein, partial [uncultured Lutibacter sp.]|uniref:Ig-like domain-containing protein n=1 Tax=uncultured Lutibacter sp. TaxID=437739 RepID=UPI00260DF8CB